MKCINPRSLILALLLSVAVMVLDYVTKQQMMAVLLNPPHSRPVIEGWFHLTPVWNRGVSFGLFKADAAHQVWYLLGLTAIVTSLVVYWLWTAITFRLRLACGLILGGALGNAYDRIRYGAVFDYLDVFYRHWHWPAFNLADVAIVMGVSLMVWDNLFRTPTEKS